MKHAKFRRSESGLYAATWSQTSLEGALQARGEGTALSLWIVVHSILEVVGFVTGRTASTCQFVNAKLHLLDPPSAFVRPYLPTGMLFCWLSAALCRLTPQAAGTERMGSPAGFMRSWQVWVSDSPRSPSVPRSLVGVWFPAFRIQRDVPWIPSPKPAAPNPHRQPARTSTQPRNFEEALTRALSRRRPDTRPSPMSTQPGARSD